MPEHLTPPQIAALTGLPLWAIRRCIDNLQLGTRVGLYRSVPSTEVARIREHVEQRAQRGPSGGSRL